MLRYVVDVTVRFSQSYIFYISGSKEQGKSSQSPDLKDLAEIDRRIGELGFGTRNYLINALFAVMLNLIQLFFLFLLKLFVHTREISETITNT